MEPKWLIGQPASPERVTQQAEQSAPVQPKGEPQGTYKGKTAAQWRAEATVGTKRLCELSAQLAEHDGIMEFPALFNLVGALVPQARWIRTRAGKWVWRIGTGEGAAWFNPSVALSGRRRRDNDAAKGYQVGLVRRRAQVRSQATGAGMIYFIAEVDHSPIEIVDNGSLGTQYQDR